MRIQVGDIIQHKNNTDVMFGIVSVYFPVVRDKIKLKGYWLLTPYISPTNEILTDLDEIEIKADSLQDWTKVETASQNS